MAVPENVFSPRTGGFSGQNARRTGVPTHHQITSSGEVSMVSVRIAPQHFPTPELALRAGTGVGLGKMRYFASLQADTAQRVYERLCMSVRADSSHEERVAAVADAYAEVLAWRYTAARGGAIVGGTGAVDGSDAERFRTPITDDSPNLDRIGEIGRFRDGSRFDPETRTYVGGECTPASRITEAYGRAALARFAVECPNGDVLDNIVTLPDGERVTGNRLIRGETARQAGAELAARVAARGLDASQMEIGGDPLYVVTASAADRERMRRAAFELLAADHVDLGTWWRAAYLTYQSPTNKKGSDAAHRVFLVATGLWRLGHVPDLPHDLDLRCMVLGQTAATSLPFVCGGAA